jgi:ankyrin repeat protein
MFMTNEKIETTADGFRKLTHDAIFIACSQDVASLRSEVERAIKNILHRLAPGAELKPYSWDIETSDTGFDQTKSMQKSLPRPSDEKCLGVVCLMAERIGHPLEDDFDLRLINNIEAWTEPEHNYRLIHPWPTDLEEQRRLIESGGYPLTGTVFEFIDGYSTKTPVRFCLIADRPIEPTNRHLVGLGNYRLRSEKAKNISDAEFDDWKQNDYNLQTAAVKNFVCALIKKGIDQNALQDREKVIEDVKRFVAHEIIKVNVQNTNPYKFLNYFDVFDADNFYGREKEIERATRDLENRFNSARERNVVRIVGRSGAGKSSFLRAGLLARFQEADYRGDVRTVIFRPTDFQKADGTPVEIVRSIFDFVEQQQPDLKIPPGRRIDVCKQGPRAAQSAVELLHSLLPKATNGKTSRLIFGVDQFEEIVDYLSDKQQEAQWYPIIQFIDAAGRSEAIGIAYTLETSRKDSLEQLGLPSVFTETDDIEIDGYSSEFIRSIIEEPFKKAGYPLSREVIKTIEENARSLIDGPRTENSILPLIALKLSHLFDDIQNKREPATNTDLIETSGVAFDENAANNPSFIQLDEVRDQLNFNSLIEEEAKKAWKEGTGTTVVDPSAIDFFLQPLVGIGGMNFDHLQLQTMQRPHYSTEQKLAESFERHRLLVPAAKGLRLVHEAVIRYWPDALKWFENKQEFLKKQALFRLKAGEWAGNGRSADVTTITENAIDIATEILSAYLRAWSFSQKESDFLSDDDRLLRDYCLFVFRQSRTPAKIIQYMGKETCPHVCRAATYGMVDLLEVFRQIDPACLELADQRGRTPLYGASWDHAETVEYLLKMGVNPTQKDSWGWPPIVAPIQMGRMDIFKKLFKAVKGEGLEGPGNFTMLHLCARHGRTEMAQMLVNIYDMEPSECNANQWMPLHYAAANGHLEAFTYFARLSDITKVTSGGFTALHLAANHGQSAIVDYLINEPRFRQHLDAETDAGVTALHLAALYKHPEVVHLLLQACDPNKPIAEANTLARNMRPIHLALVEDSYDPDSILATVHALLSDSRIDPNVVDSNGSTPLAMASNLRQAQKLLLRHPRLDPSQPISKSGETPLTVSARLGDWEAFQGLQERAPKKLSGPIDNAGNTMLHLLNAKNAPRELIENTLASVTSADLNALNNEGLTPLLVAIKEKNWALVRELLSAREIDPISHGKRKPSALMLALEVGADKDTLGKLVEVSPALLIEKDYFGWTPLHRATVSRQLDWIKWLTAEAGDPATLWEQTDLLGRRPAELASTFVREALSLDGEAVAWPPPKSWDSDLNWTPVEAADRVELIERIAPADAQEPIDDEAEIHIAALSFYDPEAIRIIRIKSPAWNDNSVNIYYLKHEDSLHRLNGTSPPIHEINSKAIALNADNALSYLRFFCFFVRGEEGPFLVAESHELAEIPSTLTEEERAELQKVLRPAFFNGYDEENAEFLVMAIVYYDNAIFMADFVIQKSGMIEMIEDRPVMDSLSAKVSQPLVVV